MPDWKTTFLKGLDPDYQPADSFRFGPPATDDELSTLEETIDAPLPDELRDFLRECNGIKQVHSIMEEPIFLHTSEMPDAIEGYHDWDWPTEHFLEWSKNIVYVCYVNGDACMYGVVIRDFASYKVGQVVSFDHDDINEAERPEDLFEIAPGGLREIVESR